MKALLALLLVAAMAVSAAAGDTAPPPPEESFLPIGLTDEEKTRLDEIGQDHQVTAPPVGVLRNPAEWEPSQGVIVRWPLWLPVSLIAEMSEDVVVTTIVGSSSEQSSAYSYYSSNGVTMTNTDFIVASTNSVWTRDYGPWFIYQDERLKIVDHVYNRPRPLDDLIPQVIGSEWALQVYGMDLITAGDNHMSDGLGRSMSTRLVYDENPGKTQAEIDSIMLAYLGNEYTVLNYIESGGIHHIDCWAKFLNPTTILIKDVPPGDASYDLLNARAEYLSQQISAWGQPYTVVRIYSPYPTAYTNSLILNGKVYVPLFGSAHDAAALQTYEDLMPGYEVHGYTGSWYSNDAIHCRTMGVPDKFMLFIDHDPVVHSPDTIGDYGITATVSDYSRAGLIADSMKVYYRTDGGPWLSAALSPGAGPDEYVGFIPSQAAGTDIEYYLQAADNSGRVETHPYIGAPWAHELRVNVPPQIVSADSFACASGNTFAYCPDIADADDTAHSITYADLPAWLTIQNDTLVGAPPQGWYLADFSVEVADPFSQVTASVTVSVYFCGDVNEDGNGPNVTDLTALVNYLFKGAPGPSELQAADVNANGSVNVEDLTYLVNFLFKGGPSPSCP